MIDAVSKRTPYLSLRHARPGRIEGDGRLPPGWGGEHTTDVEVLNVDLEVDGPSVVVRFKFNANVASDYFGLCVGQYLPAEKDTVVALEADVTMVEWDNVDAAFVVLREWRAGGEFIGESSRPLKLNHEPQLAAVAHEVAAESRVIRPLLLARREAAGPGGLTVMLSGLAFGTPHDQPRGFWD